MYKKMNGKIGVFDSGIGGVTVLREIIKLLPNEEYIYYSDSKNLPYGDKSDLEIIKICENIVEILISQNCKIIVIACNTASAKAVDYLRGKYKDIIFIAIEPAYKMVYDSKESGETLVMATKGTIESEKFHMLLEKYASEKVKTYLAPCDGLADKIEEGLEEEILENLKQNIQKYKGKVKNVVLGCTHYPLAIKQIKQILGDVKCFEGSKNIAIHLKDVLEGSNKNIKNDDMINNKYSKYTNVRFIDSLGLEIKEKRFFKILEKEKENKNEK